MPLSFYHYIITKIRSKVQYKDLFCKLLFTYLQKATVIFLSTRGSTRVNIRHLRYSPLQKLKSINSVMLILNIQQIHSHPYFLPRCTAIWQWDAFVDKALVGAFVLVEDLLHCLAAFKHFHLFLLFQRHLQPLLSLQKLLF